LALSFNRSWIVPTIAALSCAASLAATPALACGFHGTIPHTTLDGMYPGSLSVAVALRKAADAGVIDAAALEIPRTGAALYIDAVARLHKLRKNLAASPRASGLPASFSLGYVESGLWTRYAQSDGEIGVAVHVDGPDDGEAVVLTGEPVLTALLAGTLSMDDALAEGLVVIDANGSETAAIRKAFVAASAAPRVSSR
jgi:hypothetical protein